MNGNADNRLLVVVAITFSLASYFYHGIAKPLLLPNSDFIGYYGTGLACRQGANVYDATVLYGYISRYNPNCYKQPCLYPPFPVVLFSLLSFMPFAVSKFVWLILNQIATVSAFWLTISGLNLPVNSLLWAIFGVLVLNFQPLYISHLHGQINAWLWLLIGAGYYSWRKKQAGWASFWCAIAAGIKIIPIIPLYYLLWRGGKRAWLGALGAFLVYIGVSFLGMPWVHQKHYYFGVLPFFVGSERGSNSFLNQSLSAFLGRLGGISNRFSCWFSNGLWYSLMYLIGCMLFLGISLWVSRRKGKDDYGIGYLIFVALMGILPAISWESHKVVLLTPIMVGFYVISTSTSVSLKDRCLWTLVLGWAGLTLRYGYDLPLFQRGILVLVASAKFYANLLIWLSLVLLLRKINEDMT